MEYYFLSSGAKPIYKESAVLVRGFISKEPKVEDLRNPDHIVYRDCLVVYDQKTEEFHAYAFEDWVNIEDRRIPKSPSPFEPLSKRYPYYKENQEQKATTRLEEIHNKLLSVWEKEEKEDITSEELKQEVEKLISPFVGTPPSLGFDIFGNSKADSPLSLFFDSIPAKDWRLPLEKSASTYSFFDKELKESMSNELIADYVKNRLKSTPKEENKEEEQPEDTELSRVLIREIIKDLNNLIKDKNTGLKIICIFAPPPSD